ncbi:MAG: hypothetical protein ACYTF1_19035, partial [Planctomycetota bacterium]
EEYIIPKKQNPAVLIFGSSRTRGAFLPTIMEQQMGFERGQVLNFGMGGDGVTRVFDALKIYQRNRDILGKANIMIIELDSGQFNSIPPTNERFRYLMSFFDWLEYKGEARLSLLRSCVFKLPDVFPYIREYIKYWLSHKHAPKPVGIDEYGRLALVRIANDHEEGISRENVISNSINDGYWDYKYSEIYEGYLKKLISMANEDGLSVCILQIPYPEKYIKILKRHPKNPYGQFTKNVSNAVIGLADSVQFWEAASEVGLSNQGFRDLEHLNTGGAIKWTTFFVGWLKTNLYSNGAHG